MSGGASSLIGAPLRGMNEADLTLLYELLLGVGARHRRDTNAVRKRFSRWGAGRLALALAPAATHCLAISDVAGDDLRRDRFGSVRARRDHACKDVTAILQRANLLTRIPQTHRDYLTAVDARHDSRNADRRRIRRSRTSRRASIGNNDLAVDGAAAFARERGYERRRRRRRA